MPTPTSQDLFTLTGAEPGSVQSGFSVATLLVAIGLLGVLTAILISFSANSAKTVRYQERTSSLDEPGSVLQNFLFKRCNLGNFLDFSVVTGNQSGFPIEVGRLERVAFSGRSVLKLGTTNGVSVDRIAVMQDGPVLGSGSHLVSLHILVEASATKDGHAQARPATDTQSTTRIVRRYPFLVRVPAGSSKPSGCETSASTREEMCTQRGGIWQGDYATPRCLLQ